jgi:hypothetical protein
MSAGTETEKAGLVLVTLVTLVLQCSRKRRKTG